MQQYPHAQTAQGLASLGRGDDSMLMHITPEEFQDFNQMAKSAGYEHIPINPETGLPEFGFGKAFKSVRKAVSKVLKSPIVRTILPIAAGAILGPGGYGVFGSSLTAGLGVGGIAALATGDIKYGLSAGLGAYGGANLGSMMSNYGTGVGRVSTAGGFDPSVAGAGPYTGPTTMTANLSPSASGGIGDLMSGAKDFGSDLFTDPSKAFENLKIASGSEVTVPGTEGTARTVATEFPDGTPMSYNPAVAATDATTVFKPGTGMDAAMTLGGPASQIAMAALSPDPMDIPRELTQEEIDIREGTDYDPTRRLDLSGDSGLRLVAGSPGLDTSEDGSLDLIDEEVTDVTYAANGGLMRLDNGGYLQGPGDGMSDDIPANINGVQEAALSEGEFVIPADVVSHLGNGSSNAGSKKLYSMMDKIRKDRTGNKEQGKEIDAYNYMPA